MQRIAAIPYHQHDLIHSRLSMDMDLPTPPRRSGRTVALDSNGRGYLADKLKWTRERLDDWLYSNTVRPHLQYWTACCISTAERMNDAMEWIETGPTGYFYHESELEEDLLLMCLSGSCDPFEDEGGRYSDKTIATDMWITQELWARAAWRIVQANCGAGQVFERQMQIHAPKVYVIVIEM